MDRESWIVHKEVESFNVISQFYSEQSPTDLNSLM